MALPAALTLVTVTGTYYDPAGGLAAGSVEFQLTTSASAPGGPAIVSSPVTVALAAGHLSVPLPATDAAAWTTTGLQYRVTVKLTGVPWDTWYFTLPAATPGGTVDLAALPRAVVAQPLVSYELQANKGLAGGYAGLDAGAHVPLSQMALAAQAAGIWGPADLGYKTWTPGGPFLSGQTTAAAVAGTIYVTRVPVPAPISITTVVTQVITAGATLTAGQCFGALWSNTKGLLATSLDQAAAWASVGRKAVNVGALNLPVGVVFWGWWFNGTTPPRFMAGTNGAAVSNGELAAANALWATADVGRTTLPPDPLGAFTAVSQSQWVGLF